MVMFNDVVPIECWAMENDMLIEYYLMTIQNSYMHHELTSSVRATVVPC